METWFRWWDGIKIHYVEVGWFLLILDTPGANNSQTAKASIEFVPLVKDRGVIPSISSSDSRIRLWTFSSMPSTITCNETSASVVRLSSYI